MDSESVVPHSAMVRRGSPSFAGVQLAGIAAAVGAAIIVAAAVVPVVTIQSPPATATASSAYTPAPEPSSAPVMTAQPRVTLMAHDGVAVLGLAAIPLAVALGVALLLWFAIRRGSRPAVSAAWVLAVVLTAAAVVGFVTILIGVVAIPVGVLLIVACAQAAPSAPARNRTLIQPPPPSQPPPQAAGGRR